eukprot:TRINITY_DN2792_c0_g1_i2.p1 TRINITY_DN2792_c0_g1~~TRINITY_DN2792_c0_g1_i2.p1  ORF type:complete len:261 (-),score=66.44 TRINITY_DN2792_c0_g1_i2:11-793(-)
MYVENHRSATEDCDTAISLDPLNIKAYYRASQAQYALRNWEKAEDYCLSGLKIEPDNKSLQAEKVKIEKQVVAEKKRMEEKYKQQEFIRQQKESLKKAIESKNIKMGNHLFKNISEHSKKSEISLDDEGKTHWPVVFVYEEYHQIDFIEDFAEDTCFGDHLSIMFPPGEFCDWDTRKAYTYPDLEVYAVFNQVPPLEGPTERGPQKKVKINHASPLIKVLQHPEYVVPGIPIFYVISTKGTYKNKFLKIPVSELNKENNE